MLISCDLLRVVTKRGRLKEPNISEFVQGLKRYTQEYINMLTQ